MKINICQVCGIFWRPNEMLRVELLRCINAGKCPNCARF